MIVEDTVSPEGSSANDVSVGQDVTILSVDDEACGLAGQCRVRVECASLAEVDGDDF